MGEIYYGQWGLSIENGIEWEESEREEIYGGRVGGSGLEREGDFLKRWKKQKSLDDCYHRTYTNNENEYIVIVVIRLLLLLRGY